MILENIPLLSLIIFLPVLGSFFIAMVDKSVSPMNTRYVGLWVTGTVFLMSIVLMCLFSFEKAGFQFMDRVPIVDRLGLDYLVGVDALSVPFIVITTFIFPLSIIASWDREIKNLKFFVSLLLILETLVLGAFCSLNLLAFYIFFESVLVPICFLASISKNDTKLDVGFRSILYTLIGSVFLLVSILKIFDLMGTFSFISILEKSFPHSIETFLFLGFLISFITKVPMVPFHTWLPNAYAESSAPIAMIISGAAMKLSVYGILRFLPFMFPHAFDFFAPWLYAAFLISFLYTAFVAYDQKYVRRLLGYLSISQISLALAGIFSLSLMGVIGGVFNVFMQSLLFPAVFYITNLLYARLNTDRIKFYGGVGQVMPQFSVLFFFCCLALGGIPGSALFIGNFFLIGGVGVNNPMIPGFAIVLGLFLFSLSLVWLYRRVVFGVITEAMIRGLKDLTLRERSLSIILIVTVFFFGVFPHGPLNFTKKFSETLFKHREKIRP